MSWRLWHVILFGLRQVKTFTDDFAMLIALSFLECPKSLCALDLLISITAHPTSLMLWTFVQNNWPFGVFTLMSKGIVTAPLDTHILFLSPLSIQLSITHLVTDNRLNWACSACTTSFRVTLITRVPISLAIIPYVSLVALDKIFSPFLTVTCSFLLLSGFAIAFLWCALCTVAIASSIHMSSLFSTRNSFGVDMLGSASSFNSSSNWVLSADYSS